MKQLLADAAGIPIAEPGSQEPVLLGSAMLGAVAAGASPSLQDAMASMSSIGTVYQPASGEIAELHKRSFQTFEALQATGRMTREVDA